MMKKFRALAVSRGEGRRLPGKGEEETFLSGDSVLYLSRCLSYTVVFVNSQQIYNLYLYVSWYMYSTSKGIKNKKQILSSS